MFEKRVLVPNLTVADVHGSPVALWDFRQKSHVVLLWDPSASAETRERWRSSITMDQKQWSWLNVTFLILKEAPADLQPGVYCIDRYGLFLNYFPVDRWTFDDLDREFVYYEAKHC